MAEHHQPEAIINQLINELRSVLSRWNTSVLNGQIIIKFGDTSVPDITYQSTACTSNVDSELSPKIFHSVSSSNLSNFGKENSFHTSRDTIDSTRHFSQTFPPTCHAQDGSISERTDGQIFDSLNSTMNSDVMHLTVNEKYLSTYDSVTPSRFSYSSALASSSMTYSSSVPHEDSFTPFENVMLENKAHSVENVLGFSENVHEQNPEKIQTLPQTCCNNLNAFQDIAAQHSSALIDPVVPVVEEGIDSRPALSRELRPEMNTVSSCVDSCAQQNGFYGDKLERRNIEISNITSISTNTIDKGLPETNENCSDVISRLKKMIEDKNVFENAIGRESINDVNKQQFSYTSETSDGEISAIDLQKFSHSELLKIVVDLIHLKEPRQNGSITFQQGSQIADPHEMKTTSSRYCEDKREKANGEFLSPQFSAKDEPLLKNTFLSSTTDNGKTKVNAQNIARKEINSESELLTKSNDKQVLEKSDSDLSVSVQNVKPLKKRTRLCANFKDLSFKPLESERQELMRKTDGASEQPHFHPKKEKSANAKEKVYVKQKVIKKSSFICKICKTTFTTRHDYRQHIRSHDGSFKCNICGKIMKTKDSLYHHQRGLHSKEKPYHCKDCGISFNFHHSYKLHLQKHRGERPHKCQYCEKDYLTLYHLKEHMQAVHSNVCIMCHICGKKFSYNSALRLHLHRHSGDLPHKCSLCSKKFVTKHALKIHSISHVKEKNFQCETCGKCFKSKYSRNFHSKKHKKQLNRYMCDICGKTFTFKCILDSHVQIHSKLRPYVCHTCGKTFKSKASLYTHRYNVHKEGPRFPCSICGKLFKTKSCLAAHVKRHQNENTFTCSTCSAVFPDKGGLSKHMKTIHLPHKCFICKICGKTGTRGDNMRTHVKSHKNEMSSSNNPMDFIIEETATDRFSDFQNHVMKVRQRSREPKHRSGRKLYPTVQTSDQKRGIQQPGATPNRNVSKMDLKSTTSSSSTSVFPQGAMPRPSQNDFDFHVRDSSVVLSQTSKEYNGSFLSCDQSKSTSSQFLSYYCQPDIATNSPNPNNLAFPTGSLTSLLSTINSTPEPEAPPPYSYIISPHHHSYQTVVGNSHPPEPIISRPGESVNITAFGVKHDQK